MNGEVNASSLSPWLQESGLMTEKTVKNDEIIHLRPSGNAPEFRCYTEADTESRAEETNNICMGIMDTWRQR
jgi:phosphomannomutase